MIVHHLYLPQLEWKNSHNFKLNADCFSHDAGRESPQSMVAAADILVYCEIAEIQKLSFQ